MTNPVTFVTSQTLSNVDKAARQARADIAAAQPIQLLINAMATGKHNGKPLQFSDVKDIAKYLGDKLVPDLKSVDVNNRITPADPAEWVDYLLKQAGQTIDVTPAPSGEERERGSGGQVIEKPQDGGWGEKGGDARSPGGIPPSPDKQKVGVCIQKKSPEKEPYADETRHAPVNPERISSHKRPSGLNMVMDKAEF